MSRRSVWVALLVGVPVSASLLWLAFRNVDADEMWEVVRGAELERLFLAVVVIGLVYVLQGLRWRVIVGRPRPPRLRYAELVVAGIACNNVLPGRVGELYRARLIAVEANLASGRGLATVILDRSFDVVALVAFLLVSLSIVVGDTSRVSIALGAALLLVAIAVGLLFARGYTGRWARGRRRRGRMRGIARDVLEGLATPFERERIAAALALSLLAWGVWGGPQPCSLRGRSASSSACSTRCSWSRC